MRIGSLFAGIGGFDLAARWMGWETAWFSEIDPYASAVLAKHWPSVPNHGDITKIDFGSVEPVDMLCGGFPCQDISNAGRRVGITGERSGLWIEFARSIRELRPRWVVVENSGALLGRGYDVVRADLRDAGYLVARPVVMSASQVGAPHLRERQWVVAHDTGDGRGPGRQGRFDPGGSWKSEQALPAVAHTGQQERQGRTVRAGRRGWRQENLAAVDDRRGGEGDGVWQPEPGVVRVVYGIPSQVDRLRCLGNAIVPRCALAIFRAIQAHEDRMNPAAPDHGETAP